MKSESVRSGLRLVIVCFAFVAAMAAQAKTVEVPAKGDIAAAIAEAVSDETAAEVVLAAGDYAPAATITVSANVVIRGATGDPADVRVSGGSSRLVLVLAHENAVVRDLTLEKGSCGDKGNGTGARVTAGTLENCIVRGCTMGQRATGIVYVNGENALVSGCVITNNFCDGGGMEGPGGCVYVLDGIVEDSYIGYNSLNRQNTSIYHVANAPATVAGGVLRRCIVHHNLMGNFAGVKASKGSVEDCVIWNNKAAGDTSVDNRDVIGGDAKYFTGCSARFAINANCTVIDALPPSAFFGLGMSAGSGFAPHAVQFTAAAGESSYTWDFGDGTAPMTTSEPTVSHVYEAVGAYTPTVACGGKTLRAAERVHAFGNPHAVSKMADLVDALDNSVDGLVVDVASGSYVPTTLMCLFDAVEVRGAGLVGTGATVINGNGKGQRAFYLRHPDAKLSTVVMSNFSVPNKETSGTTACVVAGTVSNCVVRGCYQPANQGAKTMAVSGADGLITHCVLTNNYIGSGNGGGGQVLAVDVSAGRLENSLIAFNDGKSKAKTYPVRISGGSIVNCTIVDNVNSAVGGVYATGGSVTNCVIAGNLSGVTAADNDIQQGTESRFVACASIGEKAFNDTCCAGTAVQLFANYPFHDYAPAEGSPLIDHGVEVAPVAATDLRGNARVQGKAIDIGCYETAVADRSVTFTPAASDAFAGKAAAFTATLSGIDDLAGLVFDWDFDGDGTLDLIDGGMSVSHVYTDYGQKTVSVYVRRGTERLVEKTRENIVSVHPEEIYVVTKTTNAVPPYASWATAAATLSDAVAVAVDGMRIVLTNGTHTISSSIVLDRKIEVVGAGDEPSDVTLKRPGQDGSYAIFLQHPGAVVSGVRLDGGGQNGCVWIYAAGGTVTNSILYNGVSSNFEDNYGAGYVASTNGRISHCRITNCRRTKMGGRNYASVLRNHGFVDNCLFDHNTSVVTNEETMGVIYNAGEIRNCTIVSSTGAEGHFFYNAADGKVVNTLMATNFTGEVLKSNILGEGEFENALVDFDPWTVFKDPAAGDWHLRKFCPAVDVVKVSADEAAGTDLDGNPRLIGMRLDLGCYEAPPVPGLMLMVR